MKTSTKYKLSTIIILATVLMSYTQCVQKNNVNTKKTLKFSNNSSTNMTSNTNTTPTATTLNMPETVKSVDAFSKTVYTVTKGRCMGCHGTTQTPLHASSNVNTAYDAVINSSKVDFSNPANSRLVLKLKNENHNCWGNCASNANEMLNQIIAWKNLTAGTTADVVNTNVSGKLTNETVSVNEALNPNESNNARTVNLMTEGASLKLPMVAESMGNTSYVWTALSAGMKTLVNSEAGTATLSFKVQTTDFYKVFMYVNAPDGNSDSLYVKILGSDYKDWSIDPTNGLQWRELTNTPQKLQTEFYLSTSKMYTIELRQKDPGVKISKVILTNDMNYNPADMTQINLKATLSSSLADITGVSDSFIDVDVEIYDNYSYKISNPRIRSSKDLKVKNLKILVNGVFNPQHATYTVVNKVVTKTDSILSAASMILLKDKGDDFDKLSFSFEILEVVK